MYLFIFDFKLQKSSKVIKTERKQDKQTENKN